MDSPRPPRERRTTRRGLLRLTVAAGAAYALPRAARAGEPPAAAARAQPTRDFGKTGRKVSVFGLGCYYVGSAASDEEGARVVRTALDLGCTYVDTAPSYVQGRSERRIGIALEKRRDTVFLSTKTLKRTAGDARRDLDESLKRLKTDHVDLIQVHAVSTAEDLAEVLSERGPLPALLEAKEKGKVRFIGFTGHADPAVVRASIERGAWDSVLMPLNPTDPHWKSFREGALPAAVAKGTARVAMKVFASGRLVDGDHALSTDECLRFAFGLDVSTAIVGCSTVEHVETAARVAAEAKRLEPEQEKALIAKAKLFSGNGTPRGVEWYKARV
jgi:predicted aldo/keto reductase-like oxidoreductase